MTTTITTSSETDSEDDGGNGNGHGHKSGKASVSGGDCPTDGNHGQYVSCVAHGGNPESGPSVSDAEDNHGSVVSDAAHSDVGR